MALRICGGRSATLEFRSQVGNGSPWRSAVHSFSIGGTHATSASGPRGSDRHNSTWQPQSSACATMGCTNGSAPHTDNATRVIRRSDGATKPRGARVIMALAMWDLYSSNFMVRLVSLCHHRHQPLLLGAFHSGHPGHRDGRVPVGYRHGR